VAEHRFDLAASSLRADAADSRALAEALAAKLSEALPGQTRTRRQTARLLSRDKRLERVEVQLGDETFVLSLSGDKAETSLAKTVRGVVIKRQDLPLDAWLDALSDALGAEAERSEATRLSLERLLG
jgi:inactivated superfamily I helicase